MTHRCNPTSWDYLTVLTIIPVSKGPKLKTGNPIFSAATPRVAAPATIVRNPRIAPTNAKRATFLAAFSTWLGSETPFDKIMVIQRIKLSHPQSFKNCTHVYSRISV